VNNLSVTSQLLCPMTTMNYDGLQICFFLYEVFISNFGMHITVKCGNGAPWSDPVTVKCGKETLWSYQVMGA